MVNFNNVEIRMDWMAGLLPPGERVGAEQTDDLQIRLCVFANENIINPKNIIVEYTPLV